jgi:hypothetical protein
LHSCLCFLVSLSGVVCFMSSPGAIPEVEGNSLDWIQRWEKWWK